MVRAKLSSSSLSGRSRRIGFPHFARSATRLASRRFQVWQNWQRTVSFGAAVGGAAVPASAVIAPPLERRSSLYFGTVARRRYRENRGTWGVSSAGRAPPLQGGGQGFEPLTLHSWQTKGRHASRVSALRVAGERARRAGDPHSATHYLSPSTDLPPRSRRAVD